MRREEIISSVIDYLKENPDQPRFALCMYGGWGTGKTHFCLNTLAARIKESEGFNIARVSLFGLDKSSELSERLLAACSKQLLGDVPEGAAKAGTAVIKIGGEALLRSANKKLGDIGLSLSVSSDAMLSLLQLQKTLVILDDAERCGIDDGTLYGLINDMTENRHWFVLVVRNSRVSFSEGKHGCEAEKAFLHQLKFEPDPEALYDAILAPRLDGSPCGLDIDVRSACITAFKKCGDINARALLRLVPSLTVALKSDILTTGPYDKSGREHTLEDFVFYALGVLSGDEPKEPKASPVGADAYWLKRAYEQYCALGPVLSRLRESEIPRVEDFENAFNGYISAYYPSSPSDIRMQTLYDWYRDYAFASDEEVIDVANNLMEELKNDELKSSWIYRAYAIADRIHSLGFDEMDSLNGVVKLLKKAIDRDPFGALDGLGQNMAFSPIQGELSDPEQVDSLKLYAEESVSRKARKLFDRKAAKLDANVDPGKIFIANMTDMLKQKISPAVFLNADYVLNCFENGDAGFQMSVHHFFGGDLTSYEHVLTQDRESSLEWLDEMKRAFTEFAARDLTPHMDACRARFVVGDIDRLRNEIAANIESPN